MLVLACLCAVSVPAQQLETVAQRYRKTPNARTRAAVVRYAELHRKDQSGALAYLVLGATEIDQRQFGDAQRHLQAAEKRLPPLADYIAYLTAVSEFEQRQFPETEATLQPVWQVSPASALIAKAAALQANSYLQNNQPDKAAALINQHTADLSVPQAELLLARAYEAAGNTQAAAAHYQKIYVNYPFAKEAADAEAALSRYPAIPPQALLERGVKLVDGGDYTRAGKELTALLPRLNGADLDLARVRIGAASYLARDNQPAYDYLSSFQAATPDAEAERLYYVLECQRRLNRIDDMNATLQRLSETYPQSHWRFEALVSVAGYYVSKDQPDAAGPLYRTCYESFSSDPQASLCHWKGVWAQYMRDPAGAVALLQEHLTRYPGSDHVTTALYFLGRTAESRSDWASARAYYDELNNGYPNYYYAVLARERLETPSIAGASPSPDVLRFLASVQFPNRRVPENFVANAVTKQRIERAHLLARAGLDDLAVAELRFGAKTDGQPQIMAVELAELADQRDAPDQAIRYIKHYAPGYLSLSLDAAPEKFWRLAFPLPYRKTLEEYCRQRSVDPYLMAALIRQESEFNPKAVSRANARGLAQVMPATGRQLSRKLKMRYRTSMLFTPTVNLKLGTYYLSTLADQLMGQWEAVLASYNAGKSHVTAWLAMSNFREPAEFVESIPFNETRLYVESVLRNADVYRKLYGQKLALNPVKR
ncbi:MAG TPA: transglycosylase SLT domain-containing protein [Bryobacteraceae bacterium]|nr:transglycosylase SLT domain-containing protein [Bryobacteraceae bacterium]